MRSGADSGQQKDHLWGEGVRGACFLQNRAFLNKSKTNYKNDKNYL